MTRDAKTKAMNEATYDLNIAKDRIYRAVEKLELSGLAKDADQLMKLIYKIESIQNKY